MSGFNPSSWAVSHRSLVLYLILAAVAAGAFSYVKLGRAESSTARKRRCRRRTVSWRRS